MRQRRPSPSESSIHGFEEVLESVIDLFVNLTRPYFNLWIEIHKAETEEN